MTTTALRGAAKGSRIRIAMSPKKSGELAVTRSQIRGWYAQLGLPSKYLPTEAPVVTQFRLVVNKARWTAYVMDEMSYTLTFDEQRVNFVYPTPPSIWFDVVRSWPSGAPDRERAVVGRMQFWRETGRVNTALHANLGGDRHRVERFVKAAVDDYQKVRDTVTKGQLRDGLRPFIVDELGGIYTGETGYLLPQLGVDHPMVLKLEQLAVLCRVQVEVFPYRGGGY